MILVIVKLDVSGYMRITFQGLKTSLVLFYSYGIAKTKLPILTFLCGADFVKNSSGKIMRWWPYSTSGMDQVKVRYSFNPQRYLSKLIESILMTNFNMRWTKILELYPFYPLLHEVHQMSSCQLDIFQVNKGVTRCDTKISPSTTFEFT